jgi:hypothetical protein
MQKLNTILISIGWLSLLFAVLLAIKIIAYFNDVGQNTTLYIFYLINLVSCLVAIVLIKGELIMSRDKVLLLLNFIVHALTITQIQLNQKVDSLTENHAVVVSVIAFSILNRPNHNFVIITIILCLGMAAWFTYT